MAVSRNDRVEQLRVLGQKFGFWNHGFSFRSTCAQLFGAVDLRGKNLLEIGCGKGVFCLWAGVQGANHVVGLEPLAEGAYDSQKCFEDFRAMADALELPRAEMLPRRLQDYRAPENYFDVVLSVASINHLDEDSCVNLPKLPHAVESYQAVFQSISKMMKPGGKLIIVDAADRNFFADLGMKNPFEPTIEWFKHQDPAYWAELLGGAGFGGPRIEWVSGRMLRALGIYRMPRSMSYFTRSVFRLEISCTKQAAEWPLPLEAQPVRMAQAGLCE